MRPDGGVRAHDEHTGQTVAGRSKDGRGFIRQASEVRNDDATITEWRIEANAKPGARGKSRVVYSSHGS